MRRGDMYLAANLRTGMAISWLVADEADEVERYQAEALATWPRDRFTAQHFYRLHGLVDLALYRGRAEEAWHRLLEARNPFKRFQLHRVLLYRVDFSRDMARLALAMAARERPQERESYLKVASRAAKRLEAEGAAHLSAMALHIRAAVAKLSGEPEARVASLYERVVANLKASGLRMEAAAAQARLAELRGDSGAKEAAYREMRNEGVVRPDRMVNVLSPGFE